MRTIKMTQNRGFSKLRGALGTAAAIAALAAGLGACSQMTDPAPNQTPEQNVKSYYLKLESSTAEYHYALESKNAYMPLNDVVVMDMKGAEAGDTFNGMPINWCQWSYQNTGYGAPWYYAMSDTQVVALGVQVNNSYTDSWVELKAPLALNNSWTFMSHGELITATVTQFDGTAKVNGTVYNDVVGVSYKGSAGTIGTSWFARGIGTIYSHIERPGNEMVDMQFQSMHE